MEHPNVPPPEAIKINFPFSFYYIFLLGNNAGEPLIADVHILVLQYSKKCRAAIAWHFAFLSLTFFRSLKPGHVYRKLKPLASKGFQRMISDLQLQAWHRIQLGIFHVNYQLFFNQ